MIFIMGINNSKDTKYDKKLLSDVEKIIKCKNCGGRGYTVYYLNGCRFTGCCITEPCLMCGNRGVISDPFDQ